MRVDLFAAIALVLSLLLCATSVMSQNITVAWRGGHACELFFAGRSFRCALGENGVSASKREGDGATPLGVFPLRRAFYRADRTLSRDCLGASAALRCEATQRDFAWVDAPLDPLYNQFVRLPYAASHEELFLASSPVYDLLAVVGYNDDPVQPYRGSAIFFHVAREDFSGTAGCVAMALEDLAFVLAGVSEDTRMIITDGK